MPKDECYRCGGEYLWSWIEAFCKFGFGDGDGQIETHQVEDALTEAGYTVETHHWGLHNLIIISIKKNGHEYMPGQDSEFTVGYDDPRAYLPNEIVKLLDKELNDDGAESAF